MPAIPAIRPPPCKRKRDRQCPNGAAAHLGAPNAHGQHCQQMIGAEERVRKTTLKATNGASHNVGGNRRRLQRNEQGSCQKTQISVAARLPDHSPLRFHRHVVTRWIKVAAAKPCILRCPRPSCSDLLRTSHQSAGYYIILSLNAISPRCYILWPQHPNGR